jgi:hypothetical protein
MDGPGWIDSAALRLAQLSHIAPSDRGGYIDGADCSTVWQRRRREHARAHAFLVRVGGMNPDNQIGILHSGQVRMQNSKPIPSGA